jgi:hypothetical protein
MDIKYWLFRIYYTFLHEESDGYLPVKLEYPIVLNGTLDI